MCGEMLAPICLNLSSLLGLEVGMYRMYRKKTLS